MCPPKIPKQETQVQAPVEAPKPLASPDGATGKLNLSQLRISSKNNLKAPTGLTIPKQGV